MIHCNGAWIYILLLEDTSIITVSIGTHVQRSPGYNIYGPRRLTGRHVREKESNAGVDRKSTRLNSSHVD